ncbi:PorP/SprF family type IX secretion system membrane protein [Labilibaculum sp. K2S]|uniref:PorP/SprF family type IX secretion system membrane protein n=1 Tax=Labilibaculum sp. K2S TaxID=3056386 RepID=UPI0025A40A82|nr:PorP/SprF family type IX secretion system membrane protein [Labilibaculum sp. K2S]MDM8158718.1 PorP/SprF family type IX secretion system membrane protein [Labilibaculum sp. K2S]
MRKTIIIIFWLLVPLFILGQNTQFTNQYIFNPIALNPAIAGSGDALSANMLYRNQWVGFQGAPKTLSFSAHSPMRKQNMGLGISVINNKIGVSDETSVIGNYSFKIKMREGNLALGLGGGFIMMNTAWTELRANDPSDELIQNNSPTYLIPEVSLGVYYSMKKYHVGFSLPCMLSYTFNSSRDKYLVTNDISKYNYILSGDYEFDLQQNFQFVSSIMLKYQKEDKLDLILINKLIYMTKYSVGMAYDSQQKFFKGLFQFQLNKQFQLGYATDFNSNKLSEYKIGSHELMIRYDFKYTIKVHSPRNL